MVKFGNELRFDYTDYSWASVKFFLDCLHLIPAGPIDIATVVECIAFCQFEGKTTYDSFEVDLVEQLIDSIIKTTLPFGTKLLISAYLDKVDNFTDDRYRQKLAGKVTKETVSSLIFEFDMTNALNKRLIALCIKKGVFTDDSQQSVVFPLLMYGKELLEFRTGTFESEIGNDDVDDDFIPNAQSVTYGINFTGI